MATEDFTPILKDLAQLDIDAISAYNHAIDAIDETSIAVQLQDFKQEHELHVEELGHLIRRYGDTPPAYSRDMKGVFIAGMTKVAGVMGTTAVLKAMRINENLTNRRYREALEKWMPKEVRELVKKNYGDEKRHLNLIEQLLAKGNRQSADEEPKAYRPHRSSRSDDMVGSEFL